MERGARQTRRNRHDVAPQLTLSGARFVAVRLSVVRPSSALHSSGENCIVIVPGANAAVDVAQVAAAEGAIGGAKVLLCQNEVPLEATAAALAAARKAGVATVWNIAPCPPEAKDYPAEMFANTDVLCE